MGDGFDEASNHYTYRAEWSAEKHEYIGRCLEFPLVFESAPTARLAIARAEEAVNEVLAERAECGTEPPVPLTEHRLSGKFMVRTSRTLHARLLIEAAEQGVSLNQWVVQKLVGRPPRWDW